MSCVVQCGVLGVRLVRLALGAAVSAGWFVGNAAWQAKIKLARSPLQRVQSGCHDADMQLGCRFIGIWDVVLLRPMVVGLSPSSKLYGVSLYVYAYVYVYVYVCFITRRAADDCCILPAPLWCVCSLSVGCVQYTLVTQQLRTL